MPTHDYIIANGTGAAVRADINLALSAIVSLNSSASEPATMYAYQLWADTALGLLKIRNSANTAWITLRQLDGDFSIVAVEDGLQATPSLTFTNDLNTGVFRSGADALGIVTGGQYAIACTSTQAVGIKTANPSTALHVAGNARVGADDVTDAHLQIGKGASGNRNSYIDIVADTTYTDYGLRIIRNNTGANATSELKHRGTGALNFTTQEAAPIVFNTTNSPALTITSGGLVGIGTSNVNAGSKLHIARNTGGDSATVRLSGNDGAGDGGAAIVFADNETVKWTAFTRRFSSANKLYISTAEGDTAASKVTITEGGLVGIGTNASNANGGILQLSSGITFPATPVAATDVNTLDDYEEGTWTAAFVVGTGSITISPSFNTGRYTKVGRLVTVNLHARFSSVSSPSGGLAISGLPFVSDTNAQCRNSGTCAAIAVTSLATPMTAYLNNNENTMTLTGFVAATGGYADAGTYINASSELYITVTYYV